VLSDDRLPSTEKANQSADVETPYKIVQFRTNSRFAGNFFLSIRRKFDATIAFALGD